MGISFSTPFKCLKCNVDFMEEFKLCIHAYRDDELLSSMKEGLKASKDVHQDKYCTTNALDVWMADVEKLLFEIISVLNRPHKNCCFCYQRYKFGYDVAEKLKRVDVLNDRLKKLHEENMIFERRDIEQLRSGINAVLAKKEDLEERFRHREFTTVVQNWMTEVEKQSERVKAIERKADTLDKRATELTAQTQRDSAVENNATNQDEANRICSPKELQSIIKDLQKQQQEWADKNIVVEKPDIDQLRSLMETILASKRDIETRFGQWQFTEEAWVWMNEVNKLSQESDDVQVEVSSSHDHRLVEQVDVLCRNIQTLQDQRNKWEEKNVVLEKPPSVVGEPYCYSPQLIGMDLKVEEILGYLMGDEFSVIRIFGDGGIGKTTLLKEINSTLYKDKSKNRFSRVIFVTVSQTWSISKIQEKIASRLGVSAGKEFIEANEEENAQAIFGALGRDSFLLLLDDIWKDLDFKKIGIHLPEKSANNSKIVLTSRFEDTCSSVGVDKIIRMEYLDKEASWQLFFEACGGKQNEAIQQSNIQQVAKDVVELCGGLPLALTVIGRAVACLERLDDWKEAKQQLIKSSGGYKTKSILKVLRYSYDRLKDEVTKSCFLFCLLFGQRGEIYEDELGDYWIGEDKLVDYWIGEGLLREDQFRTLGSLRSRGRDVVRILIQAGLLQKVEHDDKNYLRMHDMIYAMAMWIESEKGGPKTVLIRDGDARPLVEAARANINDRWKKRKGRGGMESLKVRCPSLTTLSWEYIKDEVADDFFDKMLSLRVLELSGFFWSRFPSSICSLKSLLSLCLYQSSIEELPVEFGWLVNLLLLDLSWTGELRNIPKGAVSPLVNLLSLNLEGSRYPHLYDDDKEGQVSLHDLEELPRLEELMLPDVLSVEELHLLSTLPRLSKLPRELQLTEVVCNIATLFHVLEHFANLESLRIFSFSVEEGSLAGSRDLGALGNRLRILYISSCHNLSAVHVSWLLCRLLNLESLTVSSCDRLENLYCVQADDGAPSTMNCLSNLKTMTLRDLPKLSGVADGQLAFTSLVRLHVSGCPKLRRLSFPFVERDRKIRIRCDGGSDWEALEWDDDDSKSMFTPADVLGRPL